ncbi:MAG TPA: metallophosphoesterase [Anaerolineales bacterium]|nr:metallophosphoesterase [Anaerolineales bacterium]
MKILAVSDVVLELLYSPLIRERFPDVDMVISCGDLPYYYLEYILTALDIPLFFVRGNHANVVEYTSAGERTHPQGAVDLHRQTMCHNGLLMAGIEGSVRYKEGPFQYSQGEMWGLVASLVPKLLYNRVRHGRYLDIFVTHAPPWGIHDQPDRTHQGIRAFNWLLRTFKPACHFHGHIHVYQPFMVTETLYEKTRVINAYGSRELEIKNFQIKNF